MKKVIYIILAVLYITASNLVLAQENVDTRIGDSQERVAINRKIIHGDITITKPVNGMICDEIGFKELTAVKDGTSLKIEQFDFNSAGKIIQVSIVSNKGELLPIARMDSDNLSLVQVHYSDGTYNYGIIDDNFCYLLYYYYADIDSYIAVIRTVEIDTE